MVKGAVSIIDTDEGERMRFFCANPPVGLTVQVRIDRVGGTTEVLDFLPISGPAGTFQSTSVPGEPHEFTATAVLSATGTEERHVFAMRGVGRVAVVLAADVGEHADDQSSLPRPPVRQLSRRLSSSDSHVSL